LFAYIVEFTTI